MTIINRDPPAIYWYYSYIPNRCISLSALRYAPSLPNELQYSLCTHVQCQVQGVATPQTHQSSHQGKPQKSPIVCSAAKAQLSDILPLVLKHYANTTPPVTDPARIASPHSHRPIPSAGRTPQTPRACCFCLHAPKNTGWFYGPYQL